MSKFWDSQMEVKMPEEEVKPFDGTKARVGDKVWIEVKGLSRESSYGIIERINWNGSSGCVVVRTEDGCHSNWYHRDGGFGGNKGLAQLFYEKPEKE